mmetsp:Transcript_82680/g.224032  ORF Transcript_82680/g.224032 Transcript_82680/m.224032 type:complete len:86 (-) Transcript_82680:200-457(-)
MLCLVEIQMQFLDSSMPSQVWTILFLQALAPADLLRMGVLAWTASLILPLQMLDIHPEIFKRCINICLMKHARDQGCWWLQCQRP